MTNHAEDFSLAAALRATEGWDDPEDLVDPVDPDDPDASDETWESGYADADPEDLTTGEMDLAARHALRRVAGLRTELEDITEVEYRQLRLERVVLVGVWTEGSVAGRRERAWPSSRCWPRRPAPRCSTRSTSAASRPTRPPTSAAARSTALREIVAGDRRRHRHLRRRARPVPAAQPRGPGQGQGRRPYGAHPRHLRPARQVQGGPGPGRAGAAQLHEAAPARLGWQPLPPGRWPRRRRRRRHRWPWSR